MIASQLSGHCEVIGNRLWRHQQNVNRPNETRRRCVQIVVFIVIYIFVASCMYSRDELFMCSIQFYFGVYFPSCAEKKSSRKRLHSSSPYSLFMLDSSWLCKKPRPLQQWYCPMSPGIIPVWASKGFNFMCLTFNGPFCVRVAMPMLPPGD